MDKARRTQFGKLITTLTEVRVELEDVAAAEREILEGPTSEELAEDSNEAVIVAEEAAEYVEHAIDSLNSL